MKKNKNVIIIVLIIALIVSIFFNTKGSNSNNIYHLSGSNSRQNYYSIHNITKAHDISTGEGVKVGILDHSFGYESHKDMYKDVMNFQTDHWKNYINQEHHGYWMASALKEVAPSVDIYALNTYSDNETNKVDAMIKAIDWAINNNIDILTYSAASFSDENIIKLNVAMEKAYSNGIISTFIHYPNQKNILPTGLFPMNGDDQRNPDINILHYDYSVVFYDRFKIWEKDRKNIRNPFLSISSTSPVSAGFVALLLSFNQSLTSKEIKKILIETSYELEFEGNYSAHTIDIFKALKQASVTKDLK